MRRIPPQKARRKRSAKPLLIYILRMFRRCIDESFLELQRSQMLLYLKNELPYVQMMNTSSGDVFLSKEVPDITSPFLLFFIILTSQAKRFDYTYRGV